MIKQSFLSKLNPFQNKKGDSKLFPTFGRTKDRVAGANDAVASTKNVSGNIKQGIRNIASTDVSPYLKKGADYAGRIANAPVNVAEGKGIIGGLLPDFVKTGLKWLFKFIFGVAIILSFLLAIIFVYNYFQSGVGTSQIVHAEAGVQETGLPIIGKLGLTNVYNAIFNPEKLTSNYGFESEIQTYANDADLGVKLISMEQISRPYYKEPIEVLSTIRAKSNSNTQLVVTCKLGDDSPIPATISALQSTADKSNEITLIKGESTLLQAQCKFEKGIDPATKSRISTTDDYVVNPLTTKEVMPLKSSDIAKVFIAFEFNQKASHNTYFMNAEELRSLLSINQNPFKYYKINEPHLTTDRKVQSVASNGPLNLGIGTDLSQPFVEKRPYSFGLTLASNNWKGNLKQLKSLKVHIPPFMALEGDSDYGEKTFASTCSFDNTGQIDPEGFKVYTLKESLISRTNQECDKLTLEKAAITEQQCIDLFGKNKDQTFRCYFKANELSWQQGMRSDYIWAEADYIFQFENSIAVDAIKRPDMIA